MAGETSIKEVFRIPEELLRGVPMDDCPSEVMKSS
jgi:hypothetical protein